MTAKTTQFKRMLHSERLEFVMEAHSGLSARIVEEAGFGAIWASGLSIAASMGVRDNNEASWTQVLEVAEFMSDVTSIPILFDADTGYGNFNNVRRLIRKLEQREVAAICIEDKIFPKTNSFVPGGRHPLADTAEFAGKIKAAKDTQQDPDFIVVARCEALVAGLELEEALERAAIYQGAGADAIVIHSKAPNADEVLAFARAWDMATPLIVIPTTYYRTPTHLFHEAGISLAIWANHLMRASVTAMQAVASQIFEDQSLKNVEPGIAPIPEIFRLQNVQELSQAERYYLPANGANLDENGGLERKTALGGAEQDLSASS